MSKWKYDDICTPTDSIFKLCRVLVNGEEKFELHQTSGYEVQFLGRKIGLHLSDFGNWRATDMATGLRINPYDFKTRGHLIHYLLDHIPLYQKGFAEHEKKLMDEEVRFHVLLQELEENQ